MKFQNYLIIILAIFNAAVYAQTPLPYYTGFENAAQESGWQTFRKGDVSGSGWGYSSFNAYSAPMSLSHFYPVGGSVPTIDWYVSPVFNFSSGGKIDSIRHNFSGFGTPTTGDSLAVYLLNGSADPALATSKIMLLDYTVNYLNDNIWHINTNINIPAIAGQSYIAIKYMTIINWLDVMFDNIKISGSGSSGIDQVSNGGHNIRISPNPANDYIRVTGQSNSTVNYILTDSKGQVIKTFGSENLNEGSRFDISDIAAGFYFLKITDKSGFEVQKFIKL